MNLSQNKQLKAVSIFTGAGGLDIGFEQAGFQIISAVEIHPKYHKTLLINQENQIVIPSYPNRTYFQGTKIINADISTIKGAQLCDSEVDCLIGGPPCQAFSSAGKQQSIFDKRGTLIYEYLRILKELNPKTFLFENVRGLVTAKGQNAEPGEILKELLSEFNIAGYNCRVALLNAAEYGSYQRRVRCFIIGSRIAAAPEFPVPRFAEIEVNALLPEYCREKWHTLGDFLMYNADNNEENWVRPSSSLYEELKNIPDGKGLRSVGRVEATRPGGHWGYRQGTFIADQTKPARTVTGSSSQDWIRLEDGSLRRLTMKEVAALQGFPSSWLFYGSKADVFQQIGNAVPTIFGRILAATLAEYLQGDYLKYPSNNEIELPKDIIDSIQYTKYDNQKNGAYRVNNFPVE